MLLLLVRQAPLTVLPACLQHCGQLWHSAKLLLRGDERVDHRQGGVR
jgi:hypothetical protein